MVRAVLDSSVLVSAFLTPEGTSAEVLRAALSGAFVLCLSPEIVEETCRKLWEKDERTRRRYPYEDEEVDEFAMLLGTEAELTDDLPALSGAVPLDPKDDVIVATAVAAKADHLVTGDRHLLALGAHAGIRIVTPREFLDLL